MISRAIIVSVAGMALLPFGSPVFAGKSEQEAKTRKLMHAYATCVVKKKRARAEEVIVANADNETILRRYPALIDSDCLSQTAGSVQMRFGGDLYRYALADALVNDQFVAQGETSFADRLPLAHLAWPDKAQSETATAATKSKRKREDIQKNFDTAMGVAWLSRYGECVVRAEPVKSRFWLLTPPESAEELSRINDLKTAFNACLPKGTMTFNRITMRGTVAVNYYRLAKATPIANGKTP